jgi:hypothetical protein
MSRVLVLVLLAGLLVLGLSVPAMAADDAGEKWFGQLHQEANWTYNPPPFPGGVDPAATPGHRTISGAPGIEGNPGEAISQMVHLIQADEGMWAIFDNWGDFTNGSFQHSPPDS